jgi:hypothetical protein
MLKEGTKIKLTIHKKNKKGTKDYLPLVNYMP